ncbi:hypothetical protein GCM10027596_31210 [Nocardioides korecus]
MAHAPTYPAPLAPDFRLDPVLDPGPERLSDPLLTRAADPGARGAASATAALRELMTAYARTAPVRTVAVVGNAPLEPSDARAEMIDGSDLVLRMNSFVLDVPGAPACQGSRTDVVVWNRITRATGFVFHDYRDRLYALVEPMRLHGHPEMWPTSWPADLGLASVSNRAFTRPLNDLLGVPWREERLAPTTGTLATYVATRLFPEAEIRVAGLSYLDDPTQSSWQHQWGDWCPVGREHRIEQESRLLRSWVGTGRIRRLR